MFPRLAKYRILIKRCCYFFFYRCVVQQDPVAVWYMSRAFQQTSLSATGLFISDSGTLRAVRINSQGQLFFRCVIQVCFSDGITTNLCTNVSSDPVKLYYTVRHIC